ncbi:MAG: helix-turn-helix domain-containing protein [Butyrivibrio sp.]|nr:helix-turn-helix domain-containing protein [Butyrivibrio sp.]
MDTFLFHGNLVSANRILYTPSAFAKSSLIHLQEIGTLKAQKPHTSKRQNLSSYLFFIIISGSGTLTYDGISYPLCMGDCVFLDCHKPYSHTASPQLWQLKWIHFYGPNMSSIYDKYVERGGRAVFHPSSFSGYETILDRMYKIASSEDYLRDMRIYEQITSLLTFLMEESWHPENNGKVSLKRKNLQDVKDYLDRNFSEKIILDRLAEKFYINKFYLTRIFHDQFGITVTNYLLELRITHAKQQLRFTDLTIEEISRSCGFPDPNYFSRMFRKIEGTTPGKYRSSWSH